MVGISGDSGRTCRLWILEQCSGRIALEGNKGSVLYTLTLYIQHINNTAQIAELETKCAGLEATIKDQYDRINAMKLDKSVFEATMMQLNTVQNDLHEIRADIRELLKCQSQH